MPSLTWDVDPVAVNINLPFSLKFPLIAIAVLGILTAIFAARNKTSPFFGILITLVCGFAAFKWGDLQPELPIRWYSLLFVGVFLGGYALLKWQIQRGGGDEEEAGDFIVYGVLGVLVGARLGHVLFYDLDKALEDPAWVLQIWTGGLASHGAVVGLIIAMYLFTKRRGIPFLEGADRFAFSAALGATLVRIGNLLNSEIVGRIVPDQSWGFRFPRYDLGLAEAPLRYPTQVYEILLGLIILAALYIADVKAGKEKRPRGLLIALFFTLYFIGRFTIEFWKEYQIKDMGVLASEGLTMGQWLSVPGTLLGFYGIYWAFKSRLPAGWKSEYAPRYEDEDDDLDDDAFDDEELDEAPKPKKKRKKSAGEGSSEQDPTSAPKKKKRKKSARKANSEAADSSSAKDSAADEPPASEPSSSKEKPSDEDEAEAKDDDKA